MCSLKELTAHAVERVGGPIAAAKLLNVSTTEISYWCNPNHDRFIPIDHLVDLDAAAGDLFLKDLARKRGYDLETHQSAHQAADSIFRIIGRFSRACGALSCDVLDTAHKKFTKADERRALKDIRPVKDSLDQIERAISA